MNADKKATRTRQTKPQRAGASAPAGAGRLSRPFVNGAAHDEVDVAPIPLREENKRRTRARLEAATVKMLRKHGFRAMSVDQIARAAGTTRTTFYQYFKSKSDLIHFLQDTYIAPEMIEICRKLDDIRNPTWKKLREWVTEYSLTWERIHVFFEAYSDAMIDDQEVAASSVSNTYWVTGHMTNVLGRYKGAERQRVHDKLVILIVAISQMLAQVKGQRDDPRNSHLLDNFTDLFWDALFSRFPAPPKAASVRKIA